MMASFEADSLRCLYANRPYVAAFGLDEASIVGRTLAEIVGEDFAQWTDPAIDQVRSTLQPADFEHDLVTPQGAIRRVEVRLVPQFDASSQLDSLLVYLMDVTQARDSEHALRESEGRLSRFLGASIEGIVFHDGGRIADANPAFCALLGLGLHELIGRELAEFQVGPSAPLLVVGAPAGPAVDGADSVGVAAAVLPASSAVPRVERQLRQHDGQLVPVEWIELTPDDDSGLQMCAVRDLRDHKAAQAHAHYLAHHDPLTGLPNRRAFMAQLEHLMVAARKSGTSLGLLFIDLDHFQRVNDSIGHAAADDHLKTLARRIATQVRSSDRVARFGGDEFMVLLPGVREGDDVALVAHKLVTTLSLPIEIEGRPISVTPSIGVALYPRDADSPEQFIKHADAAMHVAKARGRATVSVFDPAIASSAYDNVVLEGELGHAISQGEFTLLFQPQVCARTGRPVGAEALIRWQHPERGLLTPDEFIALAEQHRLMLPIGRWVLEEAGRTAQCWHQSGRSSLTMAVNLSALQFQAADFVDGIEDLLARVGLPTGWLELEITERMLMADLPAVRERLHRLRSRGVRISVDDFGTGYSSLAYLRDLPIDRMKIDQSFVKGLPEDRASAAIAGAIIELARGLGLSVVAEGVESAEQQQCLGALRCDQLQGLVVAAPMTMDEFDTWLSGWPAQAAQLWGPDDVACWSTTDHAEVLPDR